MREKIIQICSGINNNPIILTSLNRVLSVGYYPIRDLNGNVVNYGCVWQDITPKLELITKTS